MSDKYIIKNCPCYSPKYEYCLGRATKYCKDTIYCPIKQIVDKCKKYIENYNDKVFYDNDDVKILMGKVMLSQSILSEILDIQEVE